MLIQGESNECIEARKLIGPDLVLLETTEGFARAMDHCNRCPACRWFYKQQARIKSRLLRLSDQLAAPPSLNSRVAALIREEGFTVRTAPWRRGLRWRLAGTLAVAAAALVVWLGNATQDPIKPMAPMVLEALQPQAERDAMETPEAGTLAEWFAAQNVPSFTIPQIRNASMTGGRIVQIGQRTAAAVDFMKDGTELTYVMVPMDEWATTLRTAGMSNASSNGLEVAMWEEDGTARVVLSAMSKQDLMAIAEECKNKISG